MAVSDAIIGVVMENRALNVEAIRRIVSSKLNREVSWRTINKHLNDLDDKGLVKRHVFARFKTKSTQLVTMPDVVFG